MPVRLARWSSSRLSFALCTALSLAPACKTTKAPLPPDDAEAEAAGQAAVAAAPVTAVARPAQMMPSGTSMLVVGESPTRAAEVFDRDRLMDRFGTQAKMAQAFLGSQLGFDPLDPGSYGAVGIDADGPFGLAVLDATNPVLAFFVTVGDAGKLKTLARDVSGRQRIELQERDYGGATVLRSSEPGAPALVLRGSLAVLVTPMGAAPEIDWAERLATIDPADSLSRARGYRRAMGAYDGGDVLAFLDPAGLVQQALTQAARQDAEQGDWAAQELEAARERGASAEEIQRLESVAEENRKQQASWTRREQAQRDLVALTVSGMEGLGVRLSAKSSGVFIEARGALTPDAFVRRAFHNVPGRALLPAAMGGEPILLLSGGLQPAVAQEWVELAMQGEGTSWAELATHVREAAGVDLDKELMPLLQGDGGIAISLDEPLAFEEPERLRQTLGFALHARVSDPAAAKALLARIAASTGEVGSMLNPDGDRFVADVPDYRKIWVEVAGDQLLVTTDGQLGVRVARETRGMMGRNTNPPEAWAAMMMPDRAAVFAQDLRFFALTFLASSVEMASMAEGPELADVPLSRKAKAKQKEIEALDAKIQAAQRKQQAASLAQVDAIVAPIGTTVITAALDDRGLEMLGGQFIRAESLGIVVENVIAAAMEGSPAPADQKVFELFDQRSRVEQELREIREADAARLKGRKPRGASKREPKPAAKPAK